MPQASVIQSATIHGVEPLAVSVEVVISTGLPSFNIVGMGDAAIQESRERIRAAIRASGFQMPHDKIVVNLAPGALRKTGSGFDLPIALGVLAATGQIAPSLFEDALCVGELSLDGQVRVTSGLLAYQRCARDLGLSLVTGIPDEGVVYMEGLEYRLLEHLRHCKDGRFVSSVPAKETGVVENLDFGDVYAQEAAKRALQVAAAGYHGAIMVGPAGSGKSMLAARFPSILPELSQDERIESALAYSVVGEDYSTVLAGIPPFRKPHHSSTAAGLIGGGRPPRPGEATLAHNGVLFLDELAEFSPRVLQTLREPLESGCIHLTRADGTYLFPAHFMLLTATNPCPCGLFGDPSGKCRCGVAAVRNYQNRIGGPLLDRIDIRIDVWRGESKTLLSGSSGSTSATLREGVLRGRAFAEKRMNRFGIPGSALRDLKDACQFDVKSEEFFLSLAEGRNASGRSLAKTLKIARTVADMDESKQVGIAHISEAFALRFGGGGSLL